MSAKRSRPNDLERRARMRIGNAFLNWFPPLLPSRTVGNMMGLSRSSVEHIEKLAAYKIVSRMRKVLDNLTRG